MRSLFYSLLCFVSLVPAIVYGQNKVYSPLVDILPGSNDPLSFEQYINFLYGASISIAALLAVVKIIIAGTKYMVSDVIPAKGDALADIQGAILGLLLILGAVIILEFINPQLVSRDITFQTLPERPKLTQNPSVTAAVNANTSTLLAFCGSVDVSTATTVIIRNDSDGCRPDPAAVGAGFTLQCTKIPNSSLNTKGVVNGVLECSYPKTGFGGSTEKPGGVFVYPLSNYLNSTLVNPPYLTKNGSIWALSPLSFCETYSATGLTATAKENLRNNCKEKAESDMEDFCENNAGQTSKTNTSYVCKLPVLSMPYTKFEAEYLKNRAATDTTGFTVGAFRTLCEQLIPNGELVDTDLDLSNPLYPYTDYRCVKY